MITNSNEAAARVIADLEKLDVKYLLARSFSSNFYGIPRSTKDADFVAILGDQFLTLEKELADEFDFDPQSSFEMVMGTIRDIAKAKSIPFDIDFFHLSNDEHDQSRFERKVRVFDQLIGREVWLPAAEDVIITKLRWSSIAKRGKDQEDVRDVIAVQGDEALDWDYIHH